MKQSQLNIKLVKIVFKEPRALPLLKGACGNCLTLKSTSPPWGLQGSYPQELCMEEVLKHLIEPFLLCIFFQDFFKKDAYIINLSVCWQEVEGLWTGTEMGTG